MPMELLTDLPQDKFDDTGTDDRTGHTADAEAQEACMDTDQTTDKAADHSAADTKQDIEEQATFGGVHNFIGNPTGQSTNGKSNDNIHRFIPPSG